jgi:hypothetical protein
MTRRYLFRRRRAGEFLWPGLRLGGAAALALLAPAAAAAAPLLR